MIDWVGYQVEVGGTCLHSIPTKPVAQVILCFVSALGKTVCMGSTAWLELLNASAHMPMGGSALLSLVAGPVTGAGEAAQWEAI